MNSIEALLAFAALAAFAVFALQSEKQFFKYNELESEIQMQKYFSTECSALINYFYSDSVFSIKRQGVCKNEMPAQEEGKIAAIHFRAGKIEVERGRHYE